MTKTNFEKKRVFRGHITRVLKDGGFIDQEIYFAKCVCENVRIKVGEMVIANAVETPHTPFKWTAQQVKVQRTDGRHVSRCLNIIRPSDASDQSPCAKYTDFTMNKKTSLDASLEMYSRRVDYNLAKDNPGNPTEIWLYCTVLQSVYVQQATHVVHMSRKSAREVFYEIKLKLQECYLNSIEGGNPGGGNYVKPMILVECGLYDMIVLPNLEMADMDARMADLIMTSQKFLDEVHPFVYDILFPAVYSPWMACLTDDRPTDAQYVTEMATIFLNTAIILRAKRFGCGLVRYSYPLKSGAQGRSKMVRTIPARLASDGIHPNEHTAGIFARNIEKTIEFRRLLHNDQEEPLLEIDVADAKDSLYSNYNRFIVGLGNYMNGAESHYGSQFNYSYENDQNIRRKSATLNQKTAQRDVHNEEMVVKFTPVTHRVPSYHTSDSLQRPVQTSPPKQYTPMNEVQFQKERRVVEEVGEPELFGRDDSANTSAPEVPAPNIPRTVIAAQRMCKDTPKEWRRDMKRLLSAFTLRERQIEEMREEEDEKRLADFKRRANLIIRQPIAQDPNDFSADYVPGQTVTSLKRAVFEDEDEFVCPAAKRYSAVPILQQPVESKELLSETALQPPKPPSQMLPPPKIREELRPSILGRPPIRPLLNNFGPPTQFRPDFLPRIPLLPSMRGPVPEVQMRPQGFPPRFNGPPHHEDFW